MEAYGGVDFEPSVDSAAGAGRISDLAVNGLRRYKEKEGGQFILFDPSLLEIKVSEEVSQDTKAEPDSAVSNGAE